MKTPIKIFIVVALAALFLIPLANDGSMATDAQYNVQDGGFASGDQDEASWWNSTFIYRRYYNITEPDVSDRVDTPVHLYLTFEDGHCYMDSLRVMYYNAPSMPEWLSVDFQTWNTTFYPGSDFIQSTSVSFSLSVDKGETDGDYYIYYAKEDVGSVSFPDYYPFIYRSYTFSLINLVSYYDNNRYYIDMWDGSNWNDPRTVDPRWAAGTMTPDNVPNGTLSQYGDVRYEPSSSDYTNFWGYYTVYSNYPMAVSMGLGDKGSNAAINDWFPGVNEIGDGVGTKFILGGVEGFESRNEGKYWIQAHEDNTEVSVWTIAEELDSGWKFYNGSTVDTWPAILSAGEYISKRDVVYTTYVMANATKPVSVRAGDSDSTYARDIGGYFSSINGDLVGEEFYTIDMGNSKDKTRVTNIGDTAVTVEWWRSTGSGWVKGGDLVDIPANGSANIPAGIANSGNQEDILRILGPAGSELFVEGIYNAPSVTDHGDWVPTMTGDRFGLDYRIWVGRAQKVMIMAWTNVSIDISSYSGSSSMEIPAGGIGYYMPSSSSQSLQDIHANGTISIVVAGKFGTSSPYLPSGDQGYGWMVPSYYQDGDQAGFIIDSSDEIKLYEFDITVRDFDGDPIADAFVELRELNDNPWVDDNGLGRSGLTDANGLIVFEGLGNQTYRIYTEIDAADWLSTDLTNIWVTDTVDHSIDGSITYISVTLELASIDIYFEDRMSNPMADNDNEDTTVRLDTDGNPNDDYIAHAQTDATGTAHFYRVPQNDYDVYAKYSGDHVYGYTDIENFATWSITADEFDLGSFGHSWDLPLITLDLHVESWDALDVEGATINIQNMGTYSHIKATDANGDYSFYRILNGNWTVDVYKDDDYSNTPLARNNTVTLENLYGSSSETIQLPLSRLVIRVQTGPTTYVEGAQVNVTMIGDGLVAQGTTNSTGHATFFNIHANISDPYSVSYNLTVVSGLQSNGTLIELLAKCDFDYWYINKVLIGVPDFSGAYTELNSSTYFVNENWGRNATFTVGWFDRTGTAPLDIKTAIAFDGTSWLRFTIYDGTTVMGTSTWTQAASTWIEDQPDGINFLITIDMDSWGLDVSSTTYQIVIEADTTAKDAPAPITIYLTVLAAETSQGIGTAEIIEEYGTHSEHLYWMNDLTNLGYAENLDTFEFEVKFGTIVKSFGSMINNGDGTYSLPESALSGLDIGTFIVSILLEKDNYINQTILIGATINELPMVVAVTSATNYTWSTGTESVEFEYQIAWNTTASDLTGVSVQFEWINADTGFSYLNVSRVLTASSGTLTYNFNGDILPVGNWTLKITCNYVNYAVGVVSFNIITVSEAMTILTIFGPDDQSVDWTDPATFTFDYKRGSTGLEGAQIITDWAGTVTVEYLGNGRYEVTFDTTVPATSYLISVTFMLANHEAQVDTVDLEVLVPILIQTDFGSEETPLVAYWTRSFNVTITLADMSRVATYIEFASVDYYIYDVYPGGSLLETGTISEIGSGVYQVTLTAGFASPITNEYMIRVVADDGSSVTETVIFLVLQDVPNEIVLAEGGYLPYYSDVVTVFFYWNNTLDNESISLPSSASFIVEPIDVGVGGLTNYGNGTYSFDVDTRALGMYVEPYNGFYRIRISMQADGFEPVEDVFVFFVVDDSPTTMESIGDTEGVWSEDLTLSVNLWDSRHNEAIWIGAVVEVVYNSQVIGTMTPLTFPANGTFFVTFNTSHYFASIDPDDLAYEVFIRYSLPNYVDGQIEIALRVNAIEGQITMITIGLEDGIYNNGTWSDLVPIQVFVSYISDSSPMPLSTVQYHWIGFESIGGSLAYGALTYNAIIDTSLVPVTEAAYVMTLRIEVTLQNHTVLAYDLLMELNPLEADFETETPSIEVIHGDTEFSTVTFTLDYSSSHLEDAGVSVSLNGEDLAFTFAEIGQTYEVYVNPALLSDLEAALLYDLVFSIELQNYTADSVVIPMYLLAPSTITVEESLSGEYGETIQVIFQYINDLTGLPISGATLAAYIVTADATITLDVVEYNATHYFVTIAAADVGEISGDPYTIFFEASATGYQSYTSDASTALGVDFFVREPTIYIPLLGRFPQTDVINTALLVALFGIIAASVVVGRRMRIPYQIKQIDKALKQIEKGKTGKVEKIKTIGMVISELLAPGLAELDIDAPVIESGPEDSYDDILDDDTEDLLGELDALDDVGVEDDTTPESDFEAELDAELDSISEEEPILKKAKPKKAKPKKAKAKPDPEEIAEPEPEEAEAELEFDEPEAEEVVAEVAEPEPEIEEEIESEPEEAEAELEFDEPEAEVVEPEPEEIEAEVEPEPEVEEVEPEVEIVEDEVAEDTPEVEEIIEPEPEVGTIEEPLEEPIEEPEVPIVEPKAEPEVDLKDEFIAELKSEIEGESEISDDEVSEKEISEKPKKELSKKEMIALLPPEIREKYPDEELEQLTESELHELLDYMDE